MDKLVFSREGKVDQVTTLTGEPAGHGLYGQASIGSSETLQYVGVPGAAVEARETDTLEDEEEGFSELCGVSTKRTPSEPEIQWPDYAGWSAPARLQSWHLALCCGDQGWQILTCPGYACPLVDMSIMAPSQSLGGGSISCLGVQQRDLFL